MSTKKQSAKNAQNTINVNATATTENASNSKNATATEKAREKAEKAKARENTKALKQLQKRAERDEKFVLSQAERVAKAKEKADKKPVLSYNTYGAIHEQSTLTPFAACKHFYIDMQSLCGGATLQVLSVAIGENKREFAEIYADRVRAYVSEKGGTKYTQYAVWRVLWEDLKKVTAAEYANNPQIITACKQLQTAVSDRAERMKAIKAAKAAAKAAK